MRISKCIITIVALLVILTGCIKKQNNIPTITPTSAPTSTIEESTAQKPVVSTEDPTDDETEVTSTPTDNPMSTVEVSVNPTTVASTEVSTDDEADATSTPTVAPMTTETENPYDSNGNTNLSGESPED